MQTEISNYLFQSIAEKYYNFVKKFVKDYCSEEVIKKHEAYLSSTMPEVCIRVIQYEILEKDCKVLIRLKDIKLYTDEIHINMVVPSLTIREIIRRFLSIYNVETPYDKLGKETQKEIHKWGKFFYEHKNAFAKYHINGRIYF